MSAVRHPSRGAAVAPVALIAALLLLAAPGTRAADDCDPSEMRQARTRATSVQEPGVTVSGGNGPRAALGGGIVPLPVRPPASPELGHLLGQALLVLPREGVGPLTLADGVHVTASYWSAVTCATVARLSGPSDAPPSDWLVSPSDRVAIVANDIYRPAASAVEKTGPDPYLRFQYGLAETGAERARSVTDGAGARVALLDSAPSTAHLELRKVRVAVPDTESPEPPNPADAGLHGTLMAGIIAATEHNAFGIAGVAPGSDLLAVPVCQPAEAGGAECPLYELLHGVDVAWENEVQIVNLSLVGPPNPLLERAMARLDELGVVVVAAAGNENTAEPRYPAAYPSVVGVGAVGRDGRPFARGNRGASAEIVAPGVEILSTVPGDAFAFGDGTSMAAAHVTGVLALLTAVSRDAPAARTALFALGSKRPSEAGPGVASLPPVCDVLATLARPCRN